MTCREFRVQHLAFTDRTLSDAERAQAQAHVDVCASCFRFDRVVRQGSLLVRNLTPIQVTPQFRARLEARLTRERWAQRCARVRTDCAPAYLWVASVLFAAGIVGGAVLRVAFATPHVLTLPPVVAVAIDPAVVPPSPVPAATHLVVRLDPVTPSTVATPSWLASGPRGVAPVRFIDNPPAAFPAFPPPR